MHYARLAPISGIALGALTPVHAQHGMGRLADQASMAIKNMKIADRNHDGLISREEAQNGPVPFIRAHFDAIDREHRDAVSVDDVKAYIASLQRKPPAASSTGGP
jgi:hypothetical protein